MKKFNSCRPREGCGLHQSCAKNLNAKASCRPRKRIQTRISTFVGSIQPAGSV